MPNKVKTSYIALYRVANYEIALRFTIIIPKTAYKYLKTYSKLHKNKHL